MKIIQESQDLTFFTPGCRGYSCNNCPGLCVITFHPRLIENEEEQSIPNPSLS